MIIALLVLIAAVLLFGAGPVRQFFGMVGGAILGAIGYFAIVWCLISLGWTGPAPAFAAFGIWMVAIFGLPIYRGLRGTQQKKQQNEEGMY